MNILEIQDKLKGLSEEQLAQEMRAPSGATPQFLVLSELSRRKRMRDDLAAQEQKGDQATVAEEAIAAAGVPQAALPQMAAALAPKTSATQNTGIAALAPQAMKDGGRVRRMAEGGIVVIGGDRYVEQADGTLMGEDGTVLNADGSARSWAQRNIGDPLRSLFQPIGETLREVGQPIGETLREVGQPISETLREVGQPVGDAFIATLNPPAGRASANTGAGASGAVDLDLASTAGIGPAGMAGPPGPMGYAQMIAQAGRGTPPTPAQVQESVEAGLLSSQQAADAMAMTEGTGYVPADWEQMAAAAPGASPVQEYPPMGGDWIAGMFGGQTIGDKAAIDAARAAIEAKTADEVPPTETVEEAAPADPASQGGAGGAGGAGGGMSTYEQELVNAIARSEKRAEQDKWLAVAQMGLALMSSTKPTLGGAIGEAGTQGLAAYQRSRDAAEATRLQLAEAQYAVQMAKQNLASGRGMSAKQRFDMEIDLRNSLIDELEVWQTLAESAQTEKARMDANRQIQRIMGALSGQGGAPAQDPQNTLTVPPAS